MDSAIYIVSGYMRCFTSITMKAMEAGGLAAAYNESRDKTTRDRNSDEHYSVNEGGLYELSRDQYQHPDFPLMYQGMAVKLIRHGPRHLPFHRGGYRIVFLRRDPYEIEESFKRAFSRPWREAELPVPPELLGRDMDRTVDILRARRDVNLAVFDGPSVVKSPLEHMERLRTLHGWPIDPAKAASVYKPELRRVA